MKVSHRWACAVIVQIVLVITKLVDFIAIQTDLAARLVMIQIDRRHWVIAVKEAMLQKEELFLVPLVILT